MKAAILLSVVVICCISCTERGAAPQTAPAPDSTAGYVEAVRIPAGAVPEAAPEKMPVEAESAFRGGVLRPNGNSLEIVDSTGTAVAVNPSILRTLDEGGRCPSEGFQRIAVKGDFFTIEQQTCSGMLFIDEYITFRAAGDGKIYLHKFSIVKTDREDPERSIPQQDLTSKDFGKIGFADVMPDALYELF